MFKHCTRTYNVKNTVINLLNIPEHSYHFQGKLSEQGRLLMQGPFAVWQQRREKIKDLRFKPMQRHVFLYEVSHSTLMSSKCSHYIL